VTSGPEADRVVAFCRGTAVVAAMPLRTKSGWPDDAVVALPEGEWTNVLTGDRHSGAVAFAKLRGDCPLALLEIDDAPVV
jgi:(1->4)-alpha-D-glucan 1-alpha-D-glucosylmutase